MLVEGYVAVALCTRLRTYHASHWLQNSQAEFLIDSL